MKKYQINKPNSTYMRHDMAKNTSKIILMKKGDDKVRIQKCLKTNNQ